MDSFRSAEAKNKWGQIAEAAMRKPVTITRHGRPALVVTSIQDYNELLRLKHEDLKADIQEAIVQGEQGEVTTLDSEEKRQTFLENIKARGTERLKQNQDHGPS